MHILCLEPLVYRNYYAVVTSILLYYLVLIAEIPEKAKRQRIGKKSKEKQNQKRAADRHWLG